MRKTRITLAVALATGLLVTTPFVRAAALGEVISVSAIGEPFRAEIRLTGIARSNIADCLRLGAPGDGSEGLPWLAQARVSVVGGTSPRLVVNAARPMHEPALKLAIEDTCENRLRREYTLLLPYPDAPQTAAASATRARTSNGQAAQTRGRTWTTAPGESLESLARSLYPDDANARRRFMRATAAANPVLFSTTGDQTQPLPPGTELTVPDLRKLSAASPAAKPPSKTATANTRPRSETPPKRTAPAKTAPQTDRLIVASETPSAKSPTPSSTSEALKATPSNLADTPSARERELAAAIDRSIIAEMEMTARIKELEEARVRLEAQIEALGRAAANATQTAQAPVIAVAPPAPALDQKSHITTESDSRDYYLVGGLSLAVLLLALLLRRRRLAQPAEPLKRAYTTEATNNATLTQAVIETSYRPPAMPVTVVGDMTPRNLPEIAPSFTPPAASIPGTQPEEHQSAVELAEIMMSFGRLHGAADTLSEFIRGNPKQAVTPWLKLLEVYRAAGLRTEFDAIAKELNKTFNVVAVTWNNYDALRSNELSLEQMPHIIEQIRKTWGTRECQAYLQHLLRDNRDGTRLGFPFAVIDDILMLAATLDDEIGPAG